MLAVPIFSKCTPSTKLRMRIKARRKRGGVIFMTHKKAVHKQQQNPKTIQDIRPPTSPSTSPASSNSASTASSFRFFSFALSYERARVRKCVCLLCRATFQHGEPAASCAQTLQSLCFHRYFCPTPTIKHHARDSVHANTLTLMHIILVATVTTIKYSVLGTL
jgi:hypothetical protein